MQITNNLHAFIWQSMTANNCNAYFIDGPTPVSYTHLTLPTTSP